MEHKRSDVPIFNDLGKFESASTVLHLRYLRGLTSGHDEPKLAGHLRRRSTMRKCDPHRYESQASARSPTSAADEPSHGVDVLKFNLPWR